MEGQASFEGELCPPLLVRIQSVDIASLDFQCGASAGNKSRHVTYVEATNLFILVGCTSGTVYIFSRDSLNFLFIIPFKGGKVCNVACTLDESDVAIASIRGKVSIYRISPNVHFMQSPATNSSSSPGEAFRHLYDVPHHLQNEITEMQWSPNGKYLFIGDSQGLISQVDVASLEEFPRPPPSRIILKLLSRIIQIDCIFPYMAVCTVAAVFLCDLEKEDFTRVQTVDKKSDVKSAGLCLMVHEETLQDAASVSSTQLPQGKMTLVVGEVGTSSIYQCSMEGSVTTYRKARLAAGVNNSVTCFDPKGKKFLKLGGHQSLEGSSDSPSSGSSSAELNYSLGKMLSTDDGLLISASNDRIFVYDPCTTNIILWNDEFHRINSFKIIANYGFIWHGNKLDVIAFTPFRSYAKQLLKAGLNSVLKSWINYALVSVGWQDFSFKRPSSRNNMTKDSLSDCGDSSDDNCSEIETDSIEEPLTISSEQKSPNETSIKQQRAGAMSVELFRRFMAPISEDDDFCSYVSSQLPFPLMDPRLEPLKVETEAEKLEKAWNKLQSSVKSLISVIQNKETEVDKISPESSAATGTSGNAILKLVGHVESFYKKIGVVLPVLEYKKSEMTLNKVILSVHSFLKQPQLINLQDELRYLKKSKDTKIDSSVLTPVLKLLLKSLRTQSLPVENTILTNKLCFYKYAECPVVIKYFRDIGVNSKTLFYDALVTDLILLLVPLLSEELLIDSIEESFSLETEVINMPFLWIFITSFFSQPTAAGQSFSFGSLLRNLQNELLFDKLAEDIILSVYKDSIFHLQQYEADFIYKFQPKTTASSTKNTTKCLHHFITFVILFSKSPSMKSRGFQQLLLGLFPLKRGVPKDIFDKVIQLVAINPYLLQMYQKACLEDGNSVKLCDCGIPASYTSAENANSKVPGYQRAIEEAILSTLIDNYLEQNPEDISNSPDNSSSSSNNNSRSGSITELHCISKNNKTKTEKPLKYPLPQVFAMKRLLVSKYLESPICDEIMSDRLKIKLILRTGSCEGLQSFKFNLENAKHLLDSVRFSKVETVCSECGQDIQVNKSWKLITVDCFGVWMLEKLGSMDKFAKTVEKLGMNSSGFFSLKFYLFLIKRDRLRKGRKEGSGFGDLISYSTLSCSMLH